MNIPLVFAHTEATNTRYTTEAIRSNTDNKGHIITENVENIELSQEQSIVERTKTLNALAAECNILHQKLLLVSI